MTTFDLGDPVPLVLTVKDGGGTLEDPTTITLTIRDPAGTVTTPTPTHSSTGTYNYTYTPTLAGIYAYNWVTTGTGAGALPGTFEVVDSFNRHDIVGLAEVKLVLNMDTNDTSHDAELTEYVAGITAVIEHYTGPILSTACDEFYDGGCVQLVLRHTPVLTVTTVTEMVNGISLQTLTSQPQDGISTQTAYGYTLALDSGILTRRYNGNEGLFAYGSANIHVVYTAGFAAVPPNVKRAALDLIKFNYDPQRGPRRNLGRPMAGSEDAQPLLGFWIPNRVVEQLGGNLRTPEIG